MAVDYTLVIKKIQSLEQAFVLFAASTRLPYVECDPETFDDQAYIFVDEESAKKAGMEYVQKQMPVGVVKYEKQQLLSFWMSLHMMGVNMLVFHDGMGSFKLPLNQVIKTDPKLEEPNEVPMINAALQLTTIYFMQEVRRPNQKKDDLERVRKLQALEEEMMADLVRSRFILPLDVSNVQGELDPAHPDPNLKVPFVKTPNGDIFQPIFSDAWEFQKFNQNSQQMKFRMAAIPFKGLVPSLMPQAKGYVMNPSGVNLILSREQLMAIGQSFEV